MERKSAPRELSQVTRGGVLLPSCERTTQPVWYTVRDLAVTTAQRLRTFVLVTVCGCTQLGERRASDTADAAVDAGADFEPDGGTRTPPPVDGSVPVVDATASGDVLPRPLVESMKPENGEQAFSRNVGIRISFSEPMSRAATEEALFVTLAGVRLAGLWSWNDSSTEVRFQANGLPNDGDLRSTVTVAASARAQSGRLLGEDIVRPFRWARLEEVTLSFEDGDGSSFSTDGIGGTLPQGTYFVGDSEAHRAFHTYLTFDGAFLPEDRTALVEAGLYLSDVSCTDGASAQLGSLVAERVRFPEGKPGEAYVAPALGSSGWAPNRFMTVAEMPARTEVVSVAAEVREEAFGSRRSRPRVQVRIRFEKDSDLDNLSDGCAFSAPRLVTFVERP